MVTAVRRDTDERDMIRVVACTYYLIKPSWNCVDRVKSRAFGVVLGVLLIARPPDPGLVS